VRAGQHVSAGTLSDAGTHTFCENTPTHRTFAIEGGEIVRSPIKFGHGARASPTA
jgi:hypothetical protein